jgi:rhodanese-related sulfurtransferase
MPNDRVRCLLPARWLQTAAMTADTKTALSRRGLIGLLAGGTIAAGLYVFGDRARSVPIAPDVALARVRDGSLVLVDIRRPDEWALTGVAVGAVPLDMREEGFVAALDRLIEGDRATPIALICARGGRSRKLAAQLTAAGFTGVLDVSEGMLGSAAGPGWIARGLPTLIYSAGDTG